MAIRGAIPAKGTGSTDSATAIGATVFVHAVFETGIGVTAETLRRAFPTVGAVTASCAAAIVAALFPQAHRNAILLAKELLAVESGRTSSTTAATTVDAALLTGTISYTFLLTETIRIAEELWGTVATTPAATIIATLLPGTIWLADTLAVAVAKESRGAISTAATAPIRTALLTSTVRCTFTYTGCSANEPWCAIPTTTATPIVTTLLIHAIGLAPAVCVALLQGLSGAKIVPAIVTAEGVDLTNTLLYALFLTTWRAVGYAAITVA